MRASTFSKIGVTAGAAALLVAASVSPALADPPAPGGNPTFGALVGLGSDTTQDVLNGIAAAIGDDKLASYDAVGSTTVVTRSGGISIPRASGSGAGRDLLRVAIGQTPSASVAIPGGTAPVTAANSVGQIDFARSSGGPANADLSASGVLTYVPFARDAVTVAVDADSPLAVVPWILGDSSTAGSTTPSLYNLYRGDVRFAYISGSAGSYSYDSVGKTAAGAPAGTTAYPVQAYLPKSGSGTRSYFIGKISLTEANILQINNDGAAETPAYTVVKSTFGGGNTPVEEHDGSAIQGDPAAIVPFSISQWVAQANGVGTVTDRRHGARLLSLNGTAPTTGSSGSYATNASYSAMVRDVFNIVPSALLDDAESATHEMFAGTGSLVCQQSATITAYGFQLMPGSTAASTCGYTGIDAYTASTSSITLTVPGAVGEDQAFDASVSIVSNGNGGGKVDIVDGDGHTVGTGTVAAGSATGTISATLPDLGSESLHAEFTPALPGVAGSDSSAQSVTVKVGTTTRISTIGSAKVGVSFGIVAWVDDVDPNGGTIALSDGATTLKTVTLGAGESGAYITFVPVKTSYSLVATYAPPASTEVLGSSSSAKSVTAAKGTPVVSVSIKTVKYPTKPKAVVTVTGVAGGVPTGTVTIKEGTKVLALDKPLVNGKVTITLPKLSKKTHTLTVIYNGDASWVTVSKSAKAKVS